MTSESNESRSVRVLAYVRRDHAVGVAVRLDLAGKAANRFADLLSSMELVVSCDSDGTPVIRSIDRQEVLPLSRENDFLGTGDTRSEH